MFTLLIDWDNDGNFNGPYDDVSAFLQRVEISIGIREPAALTASPGTCTLTLDNADGRFSPGNAASPLAGKLVQGRPLQVLYTSPSPTGGDLTVYLFSGFTGEFRAAGGAHPRRVTLIGRDWLAQLANRPIRLPLLENVTSGDVIRAVLAAACGGQSAAAAVNFSALPADGNTVTVNGTAYRFKAALSAPNDVLIGATPAACAENLGAAINGAAGAGSVYHAVTGRPAAVTASPTADYAARVLSDRPVRFYRLGESAGTVATDSGLNRADGTYLGGVTLGATGALSGDPDKAATFGGANGYVNLPSLDLQNRSFTVEAWIKPSASSPPATQTYFGAYRSPGTTGLIFNCWVLSSGALAIGWGGAGDVTSPANTITFGTWNHVAVAYDYQADSTRVYVNGVQVASSTGGPFIGDWPTLNIGRGAFGGDYFKGEIDEVALYWAALSNDQVADHYAARTTALGVVLTANRPGVWGNGLPVAKSGAALTLSSATLTGGTDGYPYGSSLNTGQQQQSFEFAADRWGAVETDALRAVREVTASERGLFYLTRFGTFAFRDSAWLYTPVESAAQGGAAYTALTAAQPQTVNRVVVRYTPRRLLPLSVLARATGVISVPGQSGYERWNGTIRLPEGGAVTVRLPFTDPATGIPVGAKSLILPLEPGLDYTVNDAPDGISGFDYTQTGVLVVSVVVNAGDAEITLKNAALGPLYVRNLQVRGVGIAAYDPVRITREDADSQAAYGLATTEIALPLGGRQAFAESVADQVLAEGATPRYRAERVTFQGAVWLWDSGLNANISLTEIGIGFRALWLEDAGANLPSAPYMVVGIDYVGESAGVLETTLHLRPLGQAVSSWDFSHLSPYPATLWDQAVWGL